MKIQIIQSLVPYSRYLLFQEKSRKKRRESILFLEHPPTLTAGTGAKKTNLLVPVENLQMSGIELYRIQRGGDYTAHEPGQMVIYPHVDLAKRKISVTDFIRNFRESIAISIREIWSIQLVDNTDSPGLYLEENPQKKMVSFGVYFKSFFTSFGAAINIENDLNTFQMINPCGGRSENMVSIRSLGGDIKKKGEFIQRFKERISALY